MQCAAENPSRTIWWDHADSSLRFIDQTLLPGTFRVVRCTDTGHLMGAIQRLEVRGAPALGVAGGYGVALAALCTPDGGFDGFLNSVRDTAARIGQARPTAINLSWGTGRVMGVAESAASIAEFRSSALAEADRIAAEDAEICHRIGDHGASLLPEECTVLTHCNAGALACTEWGTALGMIRSAVKSGKRVHVIACETRPLFQGARLTAWELARDDIPVTVITDSAAAFLMRRGEIGCVIVGADRISHDAVFNKIGTYMHAVCARHHGIPFYVAAPRSTFDPAGSESNVTIEERSRDEIAYSCGAPIVPERALVRNYAFDATPFSLVSALITENGVEKPPFPGRNILGKS